MTTASRARSAAARRADDGGEGWRDVAGLALIEFGLTAVVLFVAVSTVGGLFGPSSHTPGVHDRLAVLGVAVGVAIALAIESPPGRRSGAHLNPAITIPLWMLGVVPGRRVVPYVVAQLAGSVVGTAAAGGLWGPRVRSEPVSWGLIRPAVGVRPVWVLVAEALVGAIVIAVVAWVLRRHPSVHVSWVIGGLIGAQIVAFGAWTGGSASPARQFGPLVLSGGGPAFAAYLIGPVLGGVVAGALVRLPRGRLIGVSTQTRGSTVEHLVQDADE